jgi:transcriptional regulator with XRE-family HTH domain
MRQRSDNVNTNKLKGKIAEKGITLEKLAFLIGIDKSTMSRKMKNGGEGFSIKQANDIVNALGMSNAEATDIFFN